MAKESLNSLLDGLDPDAETIYFGIDLQNEKEFTFFIKKTEFLCRKTQEYDVWQRRTKMMAANQNRDTSKDDSSNCPICGISYQYAPPESHHHPVTLFNLCINTFQEWIYDNLLRDKFPLDLFQEVMNIHLCNEVEHVVLCKHCHEKYHNGEGTTREELQKIIDYKRSVKIAEAPATLKEALEIQRNIRRDETNARNKRRRELLTDDLPSLDRTSLLNDILAQAGIPIETDDLSVKLDPVLNQQ